jgi:hypothetical protein
MQFTWHGIVDGQITMNDINIPVWMGGKIIMDAMSKKETYLDFEPDSAMTDDGLQDIKNGESIPFFEICAYSEHEYLLDKEWKKKLAKVKNLFTECIMWGDGEPVRMSPTQTHGEGRHNLNWQMFQLFRCVGRRKANEEQPM